MRTQILTAGIIAALLTPAFADSPIISSPPVFRDSDGDVISSIGGADGPLYWHGGIRFETIVIATGDGVPIPVQFSPVDDSGNLPTAIEVNGTALTVERSAGQVFLRDPATGARFAATARRVSHDARTNPTQFGLD